MSSRRKVKYRDSARAKGAAIVGKSSRKRSSKMNIRGLAVRLVILAVALLECIAIVMMSSFSWIETTSSLRVFGKDLPIDDNRYYGMNVTQSAINTVDLHEYFSDTASYLFAKASSPDGKKMYFPKGSTTTPVNNEQCIAGDYRLGDTTDYNTSYYNFDIVINTTAQSKKYYLKETDKIFSVTGAQAAGNKTAAELNKVAENCYRVSVQKGDENPMIFSQSTYLTDANNPNTETALSYNAANNTSVTSSADYLTVTPSYIPTYRFNSNVDMELENSPILPVFTVSGNSSAKITFRIWFEVNEPTYLALSEVERAALRNTQVKIDFGLMNADSDTRSYLFKDYSYATEASLGSDDPANRMYFVYTDATNNAQVIVPMIPEQGDDHILWRMAYPDSGGVLRAADMISKKNHDKIMLGNNYQSCYFYYGSVNEGAPVIKQKWLLNSAPVTDGEDGSFVYIGYGYTGNETSNYDPAGCYGMWQGTAAANQPMLIEFDDRMATTNDDDYNVGAISPIENPELLDYFPNKVYASTAGSVSAACSSSTIRMHYDWQRGRFICHVPASLEGETLYFYYINGTYTDTYNLMFSTTVPENEDDPIYSAYGYTDLGTVDEVAEGTGLGTWGDIETIYLSTELIDHLNEPSYRYRMTLDGTNYYYMAGDDSALKMYAYAPVENYSVGFQMCAADADTGVVGPVSTWNRSSRQTLVEGEDPIIRDTFYPINLSASADGYWHISVLVDSTRDNLISTILAENSAHAKLQYIYEPFVSGEGDTLVAAPEVDYANMVQIDNYRWCVPGLDELKTDVFYRFTAYDGTETDAAGDLLGYAPAVFLLQHSLSGSGISYYTVTEALTGELTQTQAEP